MKKTNIKDYLIVMFRWCMFLSLLIVFTSNIKYYHGETIPEGFIIFGIICMIYCILYPLIYWVVETEGEE